MEKVTLSKEFIEHVLSETYIGAGDFVWDGFNVSFNFVELNTDSRNTKELVDAINRQAMELMYLRGSLNQANRTIRDTMYYSPEDTDDEMEDDLNG